MPKVSAGPSAWIDCYWPSSRAYGVCSSVVRALDCESRGRGFKSRHSPQISSEVAKSRSRTVVAERNEVRGSTVNRVITGSSPVGHTTQINKRMSHHTKTCPACLITKPLDCFSTRSNKGRKYPQTYCKPCETIRRAKYPRDPEVMYRASRKQAEKLKIERANGDRRDYDIYHSSRKSDRKKGLENDLDRDFIRAEISRGCTYCGGCEHMTLDRIDNDLGHTRANVVPACYRCNLTRGSMPYAAWLIVAEGMRVAHESGLFGTWMSRAISRSK
jgi:hypothetical protein